MVLSIAQIAVLTSKSYEYDYSRSFQSYRDIVVFTKYGVRNKLVMCTRVVLAKRGSRKY